MEKNKQTLKWQIWLLGPQKAISSGPILDIIHQCHLAVAPIICVCVCVCLFVRVKAGPHVEVVFLFVWLSIGCSQAEAVYAVLCFVIWDQLYQVPNALCVKFRSYSVTMVLIVSHCSITFSSFVFPFSSLVSTNLWTNQTVLEIYYWLYFIF